MSLAMWSYHNMAYATRDVARYVAVRGFGCNNSTNNCAVTLGTIATRLKSVAFAAPASQINATFTTDSGVATVCNPLTACTSSGAVWPPASSQDNMPGKTITVAASFTVSGLALLMYWPGAGTVSSGTISLPASSTQIIMF